MVQATSELETGSAAESHSVAVTEYFASETETLSAQLYLLMELGQRRSVVGLFAEMGLVADFVPAGRKQVLARQAVGNAAAVRAFHSLRRLQWSTTTKLLRKG